MKLKDLQQQVELLETKLAAEAEKMAACLQDNENQAQVAKEESIGRENLLKQEFRRELEAATVARLDAERVLFKVTNEKDDAIKNLKLLEASLEQDFTNLAASFFSDVVENQVKIDVLIEALEKGNVTDISTEDKDKESLMDKQRSLEQLCKQLEFDKEVLHQDIMKLSTEKENLMVYAQKICDSVGQLSSEDVEMMKVLRNMLPMSNEEIPTEMYSIVPDESCEITGENATTKKLESSSNERSPLKEVNQRQI
ncbi:hypothetical protein G4B88_021892 [Cannabis sativa]|uniref:Uncharacterized protein n=1 Tax=Cannabis sativa TaxID=3483 RepID=A0A7J6GZ21_CANSA|nr:hypothetical protein G4B88_029850 [Cannabis sativa]KAF4388196.1 hypothetical protein G4B88_021892 [Cannabis sativa]